MSQRRLTVQHALHVVALILVFSLHASPAMADSRSGSSTSNVSIPDAGGWVSSAITISSAPAGATVTGIDVYFKAVHPYSGDLNIDLNADAQGSLGNRDLWQREGGSADNPTRTVNGITTFNGLSVNRTWYLYARDEASGDAGYIDEWSITVYYSSTQPPGSLTLSGNHYCNTSPPVAPAVLLNWTASSGATSYYVYRNGSQYAGPFSSSQRSFDNTASVTAGQTYTYFIRATNSGGPTDSNTITVNVPSNVCSGSQPPAAPSGLQAVGSGSRVLLSWTDNSSNETGFRIERKVGTSGSWGFLVQLGSNATSYENTGLTNGTPYCYRVQATNGSGSSAFSTEDCGFPLATPALSSPANGAALTASTVTLQWSAVSGADGYGLEVGRSCGDTSVFNSAVAGTSQTLSSLSGAYSWRVRAVKGNPPGLSDYSACRSFTVGAGLPAPSTIEPGYLSAPGQTVSLTPNFRWNAVSGADGYGLYISKRVGSSYTLIFDSELRYGGPIQGTSLILPSGVLASGAEYRWDMRSHGSTGWGTAFSPELYFATESNGPRLDHFEFATISSPQIVGQPFAVTLRARNQTGGLFSFNGEVALSASTGEIRPIYADLTNGQAVLSVRLGSPGNGIVIRAFGGGATGQSNPITVSPSTVPCAAWLAGLVTNEAGDRLTDVTVFLRKGASTQQRSTTTGSYQFENLEPGAYSLWTSRNAILTQAFQVDISCGSSTRDLVHPDCPANDLTPILFVPGIMGSLTEWDGFWPPMPTLPSYSPAWNSKAWPVWSTVTSGGLVDVRYPIVGNSPGWRDLVEQLEDVDSRYKVNCTIFPVPYDWRLDLDTVVRDYLEPAINHVKQKLGKDRVDIVAHSMGSLVTRSYIQGPDYANDIRKFAMVGPPNEGAGLIYPMWQGGDPGKADSLAGGLVDIYTRVAENQYARFNGGKKIDKKSTGYHGELYKLFHERVVSMRALLPTSPTFINSSSPLVCEDNAWLAALNSDSDVERMGTSSSGDSIETKIFAGDSDRTVESVSAGNRKCQPGALYQDGKPHEETGYVFTSSGDKSVPLDSAKAANSVDFDFVHFRSSSGKHSSLVGAFKREIAEFLTDTTISETAAEAATPFVRSLSVALLGRVEPYLESPQGVGSGIRPDSSLREDAIPGSIVLIGEEASSLAVNDPPLGSYTLYLRSRQSGSYGLWLQYSDESGSVVRRVRGFNHGDIVEIRFVVQAGELILEEFPPAPGPLRADITGSATRLSWPRSPEPLVEHYNVYARREDEPDLALIGTMTANSHDPGHTWAADGSISRRTYAVSAVTADGQESFLSNEVTNDDRDHDGLSDADEAARGTNVAKQDTDGDGLTDGDEVLRNSNPLQRDTDGDGVSDGNEALSGSDPLDPASTPAAVSGGLSFYTVSPCRLLDTRGVVGGAGGGPVLAHGEKRMLTVAGNCGIPASARSIAGNVTVIQPSGSGYLVLYPGDMATPPTNSISFSSGQVRANHVVLSLASDGTATLALEALVAGGGQVHVALDVTGYYAPVAAEPPGEIVRTLTQGAAGTTGKDIWTTSVFSYDPAAHQGPGGGLDNEDLRVGGWGDEYYSLLQFDLTDLPQQASSVRLELYCLSSGSGAPTELLLDRVTEDWDWRIQGTGRDRQRLWWADRPDSLQWRAQELPAPTPGAWYTIDITDLYQVWKNGTFSNYGLQLRPTSTANRWGNFASSQHSDPSLRPRLVVVP